MQLRSNPLFFTHECFTQKRDNPYLTKVSEETEWILLVKKVDGTADDYITAHNSAKWGAAHVLISFLYTLGTEYARRAATSQNGNNLRATPSYAAMCTLSLPPIHRAV